MTTTTPLWIAEKKEESHNPRNYKEWKQRAFNMTNGEGITIFSFVRREGDDEQFEIQKIYNPAKMPVVLLSGGAARVVATLINHQNTVRPLSISNGSNSNHEY